MPRRSARSLAALQIPEGTKQPEIEIMSCLVCATVPQPLSAKLEPPTQVLDRELMLGVTTLLRFPISKAPIPLPSQDPPFHRAQDTHGPKGGSPTGMQSITVPLDFRRSTELFAQDCAQLKELRWETALLRDRAHFGHQAYGTTRRFVQDSQAAFMNEVERIREFIPSAPQFVHLDNLYQQLVDDQAALDSEAAKASAIEHELSANDSRAAKLEKSARKNARRILKTFKGFEWPTAMDRFDPDSVIAPSLRERSPPTPLDPMLQDFFDSVGKLSIMQERVHELVEMHEDDRLQRELQLDQGQIPEISEEELDVAFKSDFEQATNDLRLAQDAHSKAKAACEERGIDIQDYLEKDTARVDGELATKDLPPTDSDSSLFDEQTAQIPSAIRLTSLRLGTSNEQEERSDSQAQLPKDNSHNRILDWIPTVEQGLDPHTLKPTGHISE
nr:hypothetical protein CFP56_13400 [Quercus suber]